MQLWLREDIYKDSNLSVYGLSAYCAIRSLIANEETTNLVTTLEILSYQLTGTLKSSRRFYETLKIGLDELIENKIITKVEEYKKHYLIDCKNLFITEDNQYFTIITFEEMRKIFQIKNTNGFLLLKYFVFLVDSISSSVDVYLDAFQHKNRVVGKMTFNYLMKVSGLSKKSIIDYTKALENAELIYINRSNDFLLNEENGEISRLPNIYGRPEDKPYIDKYAENQKDYYGSYRKVTSNIQNANSKRRLAQIYLQIINGNEEKYSKEEISDVYAYVLSENKKYENLAAKHNDDSYLEKIRRVDVFDKYSFIRKNGDDIHD